MLGLGWPLGFGSTTVGSGRVGVECRVIARWVG